MENSDLLAMLEHVDPTQLTYEEWLHVGLAIQHEGFSVDVWEAWSARDAARYRNGECRCKWETFRGSSKPVTAATVVKMAIDQGYIPPRSSDDRVLDWDDSIGGRNDEYRVVDAHWVEPVDVAEPDEWNPVEQMTRYLATLFQSEDYVGYVVDSWDKDGSRLPTRGNWDRTAGQLIEQLAQCDGDVGAVIGDVDDATGAWIRFNPLDGQGVRDANVTDLRYALVESDSMTIEEQRGVYEELELPIAALVHSGNKSLHAIVRIDAPDMNEYRKRVDFLYDVCRKNGLEVDRQNRNPSRLSRLPGVVRRGRKQWLVATSIGKRSWSEWFDWIQEINDDLPDPQTLADSWDAMPPLADSLIEGVLRQGHKMLITGPSKAGKSFLLIQLCAAIAEGAEWIGKPCARGRVLYVNLELDPASCLHRFRDVYRAMELTPKHLDNIDVWNLRGKAIPMDRLAPKLIRRAAKKQYTAVVIDPIYKVITGDENAADKMAHFCNQFDRVCSELGSSVVYCHHHSKGYQGAKRSADRASGSGVFARDPDAILDLIELAVDDDLRKQQENQAICRLVARHLSESVEDWEDLAGQDDRLSETQMRSLAARLLGPRYNKELLPQVYETRREVAGRTAWRVEATLREFARCQPIDLWFDYPTHRCDDDGVLADAKPDGDEAPWKKAKKAKDENASGRAAKRARTVRAGFDFLSEDGSVLLSTLAGYADVSVRTMRSWVLGLKEFEIENGLVMEKKP